MIPFESLAESNNQRFRQLIFSEYITVHTEPSMIQGAPGMINHIVPDFQFFPFVSQEIPNTIFTSAKKLNS
jgi:hypothetical protein